MKREECINRLSKYLRSDDNRVRFVNAQNPHDLQAVANFLNVEGNTFLSPKDFSRPDCDMQLADLYQHLKGMSGVAVLRGFTAQAALLGSAELRQMLKTLAGLTFSDCKVIVLCYQCGEELVFTDSRLRNLVYDIEGAHALRGTLCLIGEDFPIPSGEKVTVGIENAGLLLEQGLPVVNIRTAKASGFYRQSLWSIKELGNAFDALCIMTASVAGLQHEWGTDEQWLAAFKTVSSAGGWDACVQREFGALGNLELAIHSWNTFSAEKQWLFFIALKLTKCNNEYLQRVVDRSDSVHGFIHNMFCILVDISWQDSSFNRLYEQRKALLLEMGLGEHVELFNYLNLIGMHAEHAIHYLTNNTLVERQKILTLLSTYAYERNEIRSILERIDPDLAMYLSVYPFKAGKWLEQYFEEYRYSKITNRISEQLTQMAQQQAIDRQYNLLQPRTSLLPIMIQDDTFVYWIDAMGVEFLPYIREKCKAHGMRLQATICCSNLPTLTSTNREFWDEISASQKAKIEELDGIKHHGLEDYDYRKSKFPIYLCRELEIIDEVLLKAQKKLLSDACKNVLLVSDHGATRMAVIKEEDIPLDVNSKGIHGGRVCEYTDEIAQIPCAVREGEWYVLANYDRFKGGQRGSVEVHGGATLEEVVVPVIRLSLQAEEIEIRITTPSPIEFSYKQLPVLGLYSSRPLEHARILLNNQWIDAQPGDDGQNFSFILPKKKASYDVTLYDGDEEIPGRIKVTVKNKVGSTNQNMGGIL